MTVPQLIFATGNPHKLEEVQAVFEGDLRIVSMREMGFSGDIEEYGKDLETNAKIKSDCIREIYGGNVFSDDSGLEIDALDGAPGVYSARYAGIGCSFEDNVTKVLKEMGDTEMRSARFRTVINLWWQGENISFEGCIEGHITSEPRGTNGFGYDPIFCPKGHELTFAEMSSETKNSLSHRTLAMQQLVEFVRKQLI